MAQPASRATKEVATSGRRRSIEILGNDGAWIIEAGRARRAGVLGCAVKQLVKRPHREPTCRRRSRASAHGMDGESGPAPRRTLSDVATPRAAPTPAAA